MKAKWALWLGCLLLGCSQPSGTPQAGSNTNWLQLCNSDDECDASSACLCGRCTLSCTSAADCGGEGRACAPATSTAMQLACRYDAPTELPGICLPGCSSVDDCAPDQACLSGTCVPGCDHSSEADQMPYAELTIPGRIELEQFDQGGQCVAYWDREEASQHNGQTRQDEWLDVHSDDVETPGAEVVGFAYADEWAEYTLSVETSGVYDFELRYATATPGSSVSLELDDTEIGRFQLEPTGDFSVWASASLLGVPLDAGASRILRVHFGLYVNHDWLEAKLEP